MNLKILKQNKNPFLHREELQVEMQSDATPSFEQVKAALEKDPDLTIIKRVDSNFGTKTFHADVVVYDNKEAKDRVEPKSKKKEEAPAAPSPAPQPASDSGQESTESPEAPQEQEAKENVEQASGEKAEEVLPDKQEPKSEDGNKK